MERGCVHRTSRSAGISEEGWIFRSICPGDGLRPVCDTAALRVSKCLDLSWRCSRAPFSVLHNPPRWTSAQHTSSVQAMSRLSSIRFAFALLFAACAGHAQDKPVDSSNVLITVTNESSLELFLRLSMTPRTAPLPPPTATESSPSPATPPARNIVTEFRIGQTVQPQEQAILQIPKGRYMVEASTPFTPTSSQVNRRVRVAPSHEFNDDVATNEVWTFELKDGPGGSLDPNDRVEQWKRTVQPARPPKSPDTTAASAGLRQTPTRTLRLAPGSEPDYGLRQIPERSLKLPPNAPLPPAAPLPVLPPTIPPPSFPTKPTPYYAPGLDKPQTPP